MAARSRLMLSTVLVLILALIGSMGVASGGTTGHWIPAQPGIRWVNGHQVGLGKALSSADGGQIFGWDINESGDDGVLSTSQDVGENAYKVSLETFDQNTAKITKVFGRHTGSKHSYLMDGIFAGDIALITHYVVPEGQFYAKRRYDLMDPASDGQITGAWTPPIRKFDVDQNAENQATSTSVLYGFDLAHDLRPLLAVTDLTNGSTSKIWLDPDTFGIGLAKVAQDYATNAAVLASSKGAPGGPPPLNTVVDLATGDMDQWPGLNEGPYGAGFVNGLAVDSMKGIACTTTELNAQVEFYSLAKHTGIAVQLPGTQAGDQLNSGAAVAVDELHHLFLVADPVYAPTGDSAIVVYDVKGNFVEAITGFNFSNRFTVVPVRVAVNPTTRTGWVDGPNIDKLQQFFY
jgi:hypothetical protein